MHVRTSWSGARQGSDIREEIQSAGAVAELLHGNHHLLQQVQVQVRQWRTLREPDVTAPFDLRPHDQSRYVEQHMLVGIAQAAAVEDERLVQQGTIAMRR